MKLHWVILISMAAGIVLGIVFQNTLEAPAWLGAELRDGTPRGAVLEGFHEGGPVARAGRKNVGTRFREGDRVVAVVTQRGSPAEQRTDIADAAALAAAIAQQEQGSVIWLEVAGVERLRSVTLGMVPGCTRDAVLEVFRFLARIFMALLKMLIIPLVFTSIVSGVAGLGGGRDFGRIGGKTFLYYIFTSGIAAATGLILVNLIRPGEKAALGLDTSASFGTERENFWEIFVRMVPENVFDALSDNGAMLQVIFFALLFGFFIPRLPDTRHRELLGDLFQAGFQVMMKLAGFVLSLVPFGVFCLVVKVVGETGLSVFEPLLWYMLTVFAGLVIHSCVSLPLILRFAGRLSPRRWVKAVSPALLTAFSTSSSSMTLPVTLESVEQRGGVSNRTTSFVLPLGATVNMDGTAIYECVGVIFLAQYYASASGQPLDLGTQLTVVAMALLASIGAAGIPSAGLVMMLTILSALRLPIEGAALLLAVDRPLDMCRTVVNVFSDTCGTAVIARSEGEDLLRGEAGS